MRHVICFDGTWNIPKSKTNVLKFYNTVEDREDQSKHYLQGVGTRFLEKFRGGALGRGLDDNVKTAYRCLVLGAAGMQNAPVDGLQHGSKATRGYQDGDEIFLVGF